jgi:hypothetical protein
MSYKKRKYFVALIPALLQYLSISYSTKHASELIAVPDDSYCGPLQLRLIPQITQLLVVPEIRSNGSRAMLKGRSEISSYPVMLSD